MGIDWFTIMFAMIIITSVRIEQNIGIMYYINDIIFWHLHTKRRLPVNINHGCKNELLCDNNNIQHKYNIIYNTFKYTYLT